MMSESQEAAIKYVILIEGVVTYIQQPSRSGCCITEARRTANSLNHKISAMPRIYITEAARNRKDKSSKKITQAAP
jgi:hypothetical protein